MSEAVTLDRGSYEVPVFGVKDAQAMIRDGTTPSANELRDGFVLEDRGAALTGDELPLRGSSVASRFLSISGLVENACEFEEGRQRFRPHTAEHEDGLVGFYYQTHTSLQAPVDDVEVSSLVVVRKYDVSQAAHEKLQSQLDVGQGTDAIWPISFESGKAKPDEPGLDRALTRRDMVLEWRYRASYGTTLVFPNGYDAKIGSSPVPLYTHEVWTVNDEGVPVNTWRFVYNTRIQRSQDSHVLQPKAGPLFRWWRRKKAEDI